jgi:hypothetical protein
MGGRGRDAAFLARVRAKRAPFTDARDGRLKSQIRLAFFVSRGKPLTTTELVEYYYVEVRLGRQIKSIDIGRPIASWHRTTVVQAAELMAVRVGRGTGRGRPVLWAPRPGLMQPGVRWVGLKRGRRPQRVRNNPLGNRSRECP